MSTTICIN